MSHRSIFAKVATVREAGTVVLLLLVLVVAGIREPRYLQPTSIQSILLWAPLLIVVGLGQMMVIVTRGIDVSVGSMVGLSAMVMGMAFRANTGMPVLEGTLIGVLVGLILGCINGALIAAARVPPIIATLGTMSAFRGLTFVVSGGQQVDSNYIPDGLTSWSLKGPVTIGSVTVSWMLVIALVMAIVGSWFLRRTRTGRDIYALGSHPEAARLRGIPVRRVTFVVYAITGALAGLAGVLYAARYSVVNPGTAGAGFELLVIAAVVIGGTNVVGGSGTALGVVLGAFFLGAVNVALAVLGIAETWQQLVYGAVILAAVMVDTAVQRTLAKGEGS